jgi:hypothetical protein
MDAVIVGYKNSGHGNDFGVEFLANDDAGMWQFH